MQGLARRCYLHSPRVYGTPGDFDWWRSDEADPDQLPAQLWFEGDLLVGFGWAADAQVDLMTDPAHDALAAEILAWAEVRRRTDPLPDGEARTLSAWSFAGDAARADLLTRRGYRRTDTALNLRSRALTGGLPDAPIPAGYLVRSLGGAGELEARVEVHRDAFAPSRMTTRRYAALDRMPIYRRDLDLVAVAPDGSFAAFCIVWYDQELQIGVFEPVGCHSAHRRRGLARAVMVEGMRRLVALGAHTAHVTSLDGSQPAESLYAALGFGVLGRNERWDLDLPPGGMAGAG